MKYKLFAGPGQQTEQAPPFWNIASTGEDSGEITLYGDVMAQKPRNWWTGEEKPGLYITPEGFMEDLEVVKGKRNIIIKINSCGGDLYSGIAIHNAIKALSANKTVIIEGIAASAASVIACAGDEIQVYPGSIIMIHGVSGLLWDYYTKEDLEKTMAGFEAAETAIAEIYHAKTGLEVNELRDLMAKETWFVGQQAVDHSFADKVIDGKEVDVSVSADHKVLFVAGTRYNSEHFHNMPAFKVVNGYTPAKGAVSLNPTNKKEEDKAMTKEELKNQYQDLISQIVSEETSAAVKAAVEEERQRIKEIESIEANIGDPELVKEAKYGENPCNAKDLAFEAMKKQTALGLSHMNNAMQDTDDSGVNNIVAAPNNGKEGELDDKQQVDAIVALYKTMIGEGKA